MKNPQITLKLNQMMLAKRQQDSFIRAQIISCIIDNNLTNNPNTCPVALFDTLHELEIDELNQRMYDLILSQETLLMAVLWPK